MTSVSGFQKLKVSEMSSNSESDDSDNESFSTINSENEDELNNLMHGNG